MKGKIKHKTEAEAEYYLTSSIVVSRKTRDILIIGHVFLKGSYIYIRFLLINKKLRTKKEYVGERARELQGEKDREEAFVSPNRSSPPGSELRMKLHIHNKWSWKPTGAFWYPAGDT